MRQTYEHLIRLLHFSLIITLLLALVVCDSERFLGVQFVTEGHQMEVYCTNQDLCVCRLPERVFVLRNINYSLKINPSQREQLSYKTLVLEFYKFHLSLSNFRKSELQVNQSLGLLTLN